MVDARLPERWLMDLALVELNPTAWKWFSFALMFCNAQGTDGRITDGQMRFIPVDASQQDISDIIATGRMQRISNGYQLVDWSTSLGQSTAASVEARRELNRQRQAKSRAAKKQDDTSDEAVTDDVTRDVTRDRIGKDRKGKVRPGQEDTPTHARVSAHPGWPTAVPGVASVEPPLVIQEEEPWSA